MASSKVLHGVMKWLARDEWQDALGQVVESHLGPPCAAAGIAIDDLEATLGEQGMAVVQACIIEDLCALDFDDVGNIVDDYLKRRGWRESAPNKRYLASLRSSVMSLYEVSGIVPGQSLLARDLLRGGEPVRVSEKAGTRSLKQWDLLAARLVNVGTKVELAGGALPLRRESGDSLRNAFIKLRAEAREEIGKPLGERRGGASIDQFTYDTELLGGGAFLFTNIWLNEVLAHAIDQALPALVNGDGEEIVFTTVRYPLKDVADLKALEGRLATMPDLQRTADDTWNWTAPASRPRAVAPEGAQLFVSHLADGQMSMGTIVLEPDALELETNSARRAQRGRELLEPVIGPFVSEPVVDTTTVAEMRAARPESERQALSSGLTPQEECVLIHDFLESHYRKILDEPVPMLGGVSPRQAARTKRGREKLVDWLKFLENGTARNEPGSPMAGYDMSWMWDELGVADRRR